MLGLLVAFMTASQADAVSKSAAIGRTAWIVATVGHSEWCPAGNVRLDLRTGLFAFTPRASRPVCEDKTLERPSTNGRLNVRALSAIRAAYLRAVAEGLKSAACRNGARPDTLVFSNGGTPVLIVTNGYATRSAPDDLSCWSDAANALHNRLDRTFSPADYR